MNEESNNKVVTVNYDELYKTETQNKNNPPINNIEELNKISESIQFDDNDVVISNSDNNDKNEKKNFIFIAMIFIILIVIILFIFPFVFKLKY